MAGRKNQKPGWTAVEIVAEAGTEFQVVETVGRVLTIVVRRQGENWPHGIDRGSGFNRIEEGNTRYVCSLD